MIKSILMIVIMFNMSIMLLALCGFADVALYEHLTDNTAISLIDLTEVPTGLGYLIVSLIGVCLVTYHLCFLFVVSTLVQEVKDFYYLYVVRED